MPSSTPQTPNRRILAQLVASTNWAPAETAAFKAAACMSDAMDHSNGYSVTIGSAEDSGCASLGDRQYTIDNISESRFREIVNEAIDEHVPPERRAAVQVSILQYTPGIPSTSTQTASASNNDGAEYVGTSSPHDSPVMTGERRIGSATTPTTGTKRPADQITGGDPSSTIEVYDPFDSNNALIGAPTESCDVVRRKIRTFIESGAMKVGEFCHAIGVSNRSYNTFLSQHGADKGSSTACYQNAWEFFQKREAAGLKMPKKRKLETADGKVKDNVSPDLSGISLPGEETDSVEIFDTCAEVRKKITAYLKRPGVTQAQFCRDLLAQMHTSRAPAKIQSNQLNSFRGQKRPDGGNTSSVFYAAYVFFEKLRIKEGKPKSKHRQTMEEIYGGKGGFDTSTAAGNKGWTCVEGSSITMDQYGRVDINSP